MAVAVGDAIACGLEGGVSLDGGGVRLSYRAVPAPIRSGNFFELEVSACDPGGGPAVLKAVDATMPAHGHGMNYRPAVTMVAPGRFRVEGLLFHMTGEWRFRFDVVAGDVRKTVTSEQVIDR